MAIIFSISLVTIWMITGLSLLAIMRFRTNFHLRLLLAPALGVAIHIIALFTLSRIGFPIKTVAMPLLLVGVLLASYFLFTQKIIWKRRTFSWFLFFALIAIIPFAWPLLKFGFEWLAFVNGDMSYYSLSSSRFLDYGYSELPVSGKIFDDTAHSLAFWFQPNVLGHRAGADLLLAHIVGITGLTAHQVYMSLMVACNACVAAGAGALTLLSSRKWSSALWAMVIVALSPLLALEVTMQLLAQGLGLVFLTGLCVAYDKTMKDKRVFVWLVATVILFSALAIAYSEVVPFFGFYVVVREVSRRKKWIVPKLRKVYLQTIAILILGVALLLNSYLMDVVKFVSLAMGFSFKSAAMTIQTNGISLFPSFFVPSGGALLWGWMPLAGDANSLIIVLGLIATLLFAGLAMMSAIRAVVPAQMSVVMLIVASAMYIGGNGFGLFKIAMFIQPFMLATLITAVTLYLTHRVILQASLVFLGLSFIPALVLNVKRVSTNVGHSIVPYATTAGIGDQLKRLGDTARSMKLAKVYSDTPIRELFMLQSYYFKGVSFRSAATPSSQERYTEKFSSLLSKADVMKLGTVNIGELNFIFDSSQVGISAKFMPTIFDVNRDTLLTATREFSLINRSNRPAGKSFYLQPIRDLKNHLMFRQTSQGTSYLSKNFADGGVALWGNESDPIFPGQTMSSIGRFHLYEVLGSMQGSSMLLSLTASMNKQDDFLLPTVRIEGANAVSPALVGRGSARVVSTPVSPRKIGNSDYIGIDFGRSGSFFEQDRSGAMGMFGNNIKLDIRRTVAFARDISYISPEQYTAFERPAAVRTFPDALGDPGLEYSGIFEDAWISDVAYVILKSPLEDQQGSLYLSGQIPNIGGASFTTNLTIRVNNQVVYKGLHTNGDVKLSIPISEFFSDSENVKIQVESSALQRLPHGDDRPVSMLLKEVGFVFDSKSENLD